LGLGISRVVIDAGHGGRDPGARVKGLNEADLTLDVAQRLEKLLLTVRGVEVVMTRRHDVYIPLEERTAIANRAGADLFLSIHVNASRNTKAHGIETYFLNFAPNPEAEAIAARENAGSSKTMHHLPDIVKAIALNNKIDESRDFATLVQRSMFDRLKKTNREARSLGVKQAPFVVLIGATMPSVLAEISFLTNRREASLLRTPAYRQAIAEALFTGISRYQKSLKAAETAAAQ
jgi:N-acetylmuramoyl-L-alanine amidase